MPEIEQHMEAAIEHHRCGRLAEAEALYRQVLVRSPDHTNALRLSGVIAMQQGRHGLALELIRRALQIKPDVPEYWVSLANALNAGGDSDGAITAYRQALRLREDYPQAHYNLGLALAEQGRFQESIEAYREAIRRKPDFRQACVNLGSVLENSGRIDEAILTYRQAIDLDPDRPDAHTNLGDVLRKSGRLDEAVAECERALSLDANLVEAHNNLGIARFEQGKYDQAIECYQRAIDLKPDFPEAFINLAMAFNAIGNPQASLQACRQVVRLKGESATARVNLGIALRNLGQLDDAIEAFEQALTLDPRHADGCGHLGVALMEKGRVEDAVAVFHRALTINPQSSRTYNDLGNALRILMRLDDAVAAYRAAVDLNPAASAHFYNLANTLLDLRRNEEAVAAYRKSLQLQPDSAQILSSLGTALAAMNRMEEAIHCYLQALRLDENFAEAHLGLSLASLALGEFERGWREYEWRWTSKELAAARPQFSQPQWEGEALDGRRILLHAEQGFGDTLHFIRYAPLVAARGGHVILVCPLELCRLMRHVPGVEEVFPAGSDLPPFDCHCALLSLPRVFGTRLESIPATVPYLAAPRALADAWEEKLPRSDSRPRVAIAWDGRSKSTRRNRVLTLSQLAVLAKAGEFVFYSVQKGEAAAQAAAVPPGMELIDLAPDLHDFADTAAALSHMDLVISIDTAAAHLAGALGKPAWVFLPHHPDWRWLLDRDDSPWYPTLRLFRQETPGAWEPVIERMAQELTRLADRSRRA